MLTIYDIAKMTGVSPSTVSRVINNKKGVGKETRKKVETVIKDNNFVINQNARGLVMQATKMIGILVADFRTMHHTEGAYIIERELFKKGYSCLVFNTSNSIEAQLEYINILSTRNVEGVILMGSIYQNPQIKEALEKYLSNIPIVMVNGYMDLPNVYSILNNDFDAVRDLVKHLSEHGRSKPAFVMGEYTASGNLKRQGYLAGAKRYLNIASPITVQTETDNESIRQCIYDLVNSNPDIDSIIFSVDLLAAISLHALKDLDIRVPEDVFVYGIDNSIYSQIACPQLSSLDTKILELSVMAARTIMLALQKEVVINRLIVPAELIERQSTVSD